jgi:hypothetical protein
MLTGGGDRGQASSRPAGKCPVVPAPVKGARKLASLRDGASATLDSHGSFQEPGAYRDEARPLLAAGVESTPASIGNHSHRGYTAGHSHKQAGELS